MYVTSGVSRPKLAMPQLRCDAGAESARRCRALQSRYLCAQLRTRLLEDLDAAGPRDRDEDGLSFNLLNLGRRGRRGRGFIERTPDIGRPLFPVRMHPIATRTPPSPRPPPLLPPFPIRLCFQLSDAPAPPAFNSTLRVRCM